MRCMSAWISCSLSGPRERDCISPVRKSLFRRRLPSKATLLTELFSLTVITVCEPRRVTRTSENRPEPCSSRRISSGEPPRAA